MKNKLIVIVITLCMLTSCNGTEKVNYVEEIEGQKAKIIELKNLIKDKEDDIESLSIELSEKKNESTNVEDMNKKITKENDAILKELEIMKEDYLKLLNEIEKKEDSLLLKLSRHKSQVNSIKDEIIFGIHFSSDYNAAGSNLLMGSNTSFIYNIIYAIDWQVDNNVSLFEGKNYSTIVKDRIQNEDKFDTLRELANKKYTFYSLDKKLMETKGYLTIEEWGEPFMVFDNPKRDGFFISGNYNYMPRNIDVKIDTEYNRGRSDRYNTIIYDNTVNTDEIISAIEPNTQGLSITQLVVCDINGDSRLEKIVNINNTFENEEYINNHWTELDFTKYMARIVILDENNNIILDIENVKNIEDPYISGKLYPIIHYVIDVDNDNIYEIIYETPTWEGADYILNRVNISNKSVLQTNYYQGL